MNRHHLLAACAFAALGISSTASAQTEAPADQAPTQKADNSDEQGAVGDIVVTAQGRAQALADVPLAVSAINAEALTRSGASDIRQLAQVAPSLLVSSTGNEANGSARLRGIGTVGDNPGLESSVAVFVDGVYRSRSGIGLNELGDIERVEVLRGPQGTLFGRNASAGIISIYSKAPNLNAGFTGGAEASYGNYDFWRFSGNLNVPLGETLAARLDGVYVKRDGFYHDVTNDTDINDRNRYFVRGQLLFEPTSDISIRLIGDYTHRDEKCCAATYIDYTVAPANGLLTTSANPIINTLKSLGLPQAALENPYSRNVYPSPGADYSGVTEDYGFSGQLDWNLGFAKLTSITGWRRYSNNQGGDVDYSFVDILNRAPGDDAYARQFKNFSQEVRLQGSAFGEKLDWLVGGYFGSEILTLRENLKFSGQYGRFATCRLLAGGALAPLQSPTSPACLGATGRAVVGGAAGADAATILASFDRLNGLNNLGDTGSVYRVKSDNWALFTHNIIHITDALSVTLGLRYTNEHKHLDALFANNNTVCPAQQAALVPILTSTTSNATAKALAGGLIGLSCQGNSTSELNGVGINGRRAEDEFTGTGIISYKVTSDLMTYASYARGYKAGGFNLDRSALKSPTLPFAVTPGGAQAFAGNLQFKPEINTAYEVGAKYSTRQFSVNIAAFRQQFDNFQLNTFNGTVFLVQNINGCKNGLNGADRDLSATTGACPASDVEYGVTSTGVEVEAAINPIRDLNFTAGFTYADTKYRNNLVGNDQGAPLDPALRRLPGDNLSNAPTTVVTSSVTWTPPIGGTGLSGLFYLDGRLTGDYNTGSDLFPQKEQDGYAIVNGRIGIRGPDSRWAIEFWAQNLFDVNYTQVAFNTAFQAGPGVNANPNFPEAQYPGGTQLFSAFLAEPRTYGLTLRGRF